MSGIFELAKINFVEWDGGNSTRENRIPIYRKVKLDGKSNNFYFTRKIDAKPCKFKLDTSSDISIVNEKFIKPPRRVEEVKDNFLVYSTEEKVPVCFKTVETVVTN